MWWWGVCTYFIIKEWNYIFDTTINMVLKCVMSKWLLKLIEVILAAYIIIVGIIGVTVIILLTMLFMIVYYVYYGLYKTIKFLINK